MIRKYERLLKEYLTLFPCVALIGSRQCGKTTLIQTLPKDWKVFDLEKQSDYRYLSVSGYRKTIPRYKRKQISPVWAAPGRHLRKCHQQ